MGAVGSSFAMALPPTRENSNLADFIAGQPTEHQQVMSPNGAPARDLGTSAALPNGVPSSTRRVQSGEDDSAYERALSGAIDGAVPLSLETAADTSTPQEDDSRNVRASEPIRTTSAPAAEINDGDRPLLPHADVNVTPTRPMRASASAGPLAPSPFPSPIQGHEVGEATTSSAAGLFVQQGAAAMRWFSRLGEYVQRRAVAHTRPGGEATATVEETVWSPRRLGAGREEEPLFSGRQLRRLRDLEGQAPQLYGSSGIGPAGASSEGSGSYSKEQLESEVRRQVELALGGQRELADENLRLRQELEQLKASRTMSASGVNAAERERSETAGMLLGCEEPPGLTRMGNYVQNSNPPPGLSGHNREHGGLGLLSDHAKVPAGDLVGRGDQDVRRSELAGTIHGDQTGIPAETSGQGWNVGEETRFLETASDETSLREVLRREVDSLRGNSYGPEGNPHGPSERLGEPRKKVGFREGEVRFSGDQSTRTFGTQPSWGSSL